MPAADHAPRALVCLPIASRTDDVGIRRPRRLSPSCVCVCVCVCLSVRDHIFRTTRPIYSKFFAHVAYGRGSVLLWRRSDTLCTSGFMDDVMFAYKPSLLDVAAQLKRSAHAALGLAISCA